jgi:hypothetical protein
VKTAMGVSATLVVAVLVVGCGGSSSSSATASEQSASSTPTAAQSVAAFKTGYESIAGQLKQTSSSIGVAIQNAPKQSDQQLGTAFHSLAERWQSQLSQLQTLKPPAELAATFNTVTGAGSRVETDLRAIASAAATHSAAAAKQAAANLVQDMLAAKAASTRITNKLSQSQ